MKKLIVMLIFGLCASLARAETIEHEIYSYTDDGNGMLVANGIRSYDASDIEVVEMNHSGEVHWAKSLDLESGFRIGASIYRESKITGFGLWAKNSPFGFSWEWLTASSSNIFDKLQEGGAVSVKYHQSNGLLEIRSISFESDISLRLNETRKTIGNITHRILIKEGSVLTFGSNTVLQRTAALTRPAAERKRSAPVTCNEDL